ncbi:MAG TPA: phosphatidate cytidylyltransferase [Thermoanaerobaculia bacterium]|nr:phosphatidate cytidylyltransferase [Thermoanaerobaculia bacterium]
MKRLLTALVGVPLVLAAIFALPPTGFLLVCLFCYGAASLEYVSISRAWAPSAPLWVVPLLAAGLGSYLSLAEPAQAVTALRLLALLMVLSIGMGILLLLSRTPVAEFPGALGAVCFGIPYFALATGGTCQLQRQDPWLVFLLLAIVWLGDTAAYYVGKRWGRRLLAPVVSPKKTWEGALASLLTGVVAAGVWGWFRLHRVDLPLIFIAAATSVGAQLGDLVESLLKRSAGVKDSGTLLPGHGGFLDRSDALLFGAPILWLGIALAGTRLVVP